MSDLTFTTTQSLLHVNRTSIAVTSNFIEVIKNFVHIAIEMFHGASKLLHRLIRKGPFAFVIFQPIFCRIDIGLLEVGKLYRIKCIFPLFPSKIIAFHCNLLISAQNTPFPMAYQFFEIIQILL